MIVSKAMLGPAAVLILWTLVVLVWVAVTRFGALAKSGVDLKAAPPGGRGRDLEQVLPAKVNWKSHNYSHLVEQPTIFYPVVLLLAVAGGGTPTNIALAWAYVAIRIVHSLWQSLVNTLPVRITLFGLSTTCLFALAINAVLLTFY